MCIHLQKRNFIAKMCTLTCCFSSTSQSKHKRFQNQWWRFRRDLCCGTVSFPLGCWRQQRVWTCRKWEFFSYGGNIYAGVNINPTQFTGILVNDTCVFYSHCHKQPGSFFSLQDPACPAVEHCIIVNKI